MRVTLSHVPPKSPTGNKNKSAPPAATGFFANRTTGPDRKQGWCAHIFRAIQFALFSPYPVAPGLPVEISGHLSLDVAHTMQVEYRPDFNKPINPFTLFQRMPMKNIQSLFILFLFCLTLILVSGCGKKPIPSYSSQTGNNAPESKELGNAGAGSISEESMPGEETLDAGGQNGQNGMAANGFGDGDAQSDEYKKLHGRSSVEMQPVYFNFDQATIRDDQIPRLEHNGDYLKNNLAHNMVIEGNTDERGTNEYNLALGERRAINAKNYLIELGVDAGRIRTVSYGEERPLFPGHSEEDWAQNRRDDFILE
jgi:peptidoglycan-associated lipoprotein